MRLFLLLTALFLVSISADAQAPPLVDDDDLQIWNDVQMTVPMTTTFDFYTSVTTRWGKKASRLNDGRYAIGFIYKPSKAWSIQPYYWFINARNSRSQFRVEHRLNLRLGYKFPVKPVSVSHRSWFEYRKRVTGNSWRYRPSITIERDLPKSFKSKIYLVDELFYDSLAKRFSRNRFTIGVTRGLTTKLSLDVYFLRQNDGISRPGDISLLGTALKIKL